ncbi:MAG: hypothetical protein IT381_16965 [Deltaproteobacteria bacterium]|nr:hypothetical protein [Deltaproteobacteria bacterium]
MSGTDEHTNELLDEVLQQASQQALRMSHLDESVAELKQQIYALREEVQMRAAGGGGPASARPLGPASGEQLMGEKVDSIERDAHSAKTKVGWLMTLAGVQTLMLGALMLFALKPMAAVSVPSPAHASSLDAVPTPAVPAPAAVEKPIENNPFAGSPSAPGVKGAEDAAKAEANAEAMKSEPKADAKAKKKKKH